MTTCEDAYDQGHGATAMARFAAIGTRAIAGAVAAFRRRMEIARSERHLRKMPDHMLKDIGLHRSEISAISRMGRMEYRR